MCVNVWACVGVHVRCFGVHVRCFLCATHGSLYIAHNVIILNGENWAHTHATASFVHWHCSWLVAYTSVMSEPLNSVRRFSNWTEIAIISRPSRRIVNCLIDKKTISLYKKEAAPEQNYVYAVGMVSCYFVLAFCVIISAVAKWSDMHEKAQKHATGSQHNWRVWLNNLQFQCFQWSCDLFCSDSFAAAMGWTVHIDFIFCSVNVLYWFVLCFIHAGVLHRVRFTTFVQYLIDKGWFLSVLCTRLCSIQSAF